MRGMKDRIPFAVNNITCVILLSLFCNAASAVEFNTDVLDAADKKNIDFTRFSEAGYVLPGQYLLDVIVNGQSISPASLQISFVEPAGNDSNLLIVFYVQIMPDDFVMQLHRF